MERLDAWDAFKHRDAERPRCLAIGAFDGIHIGHQRLIAEACTRATQVAGEAWLLTFDPHPSRVLRPGDAPPLLTSTPHKLRLLEQTGLHGVVVHPFTRALSRLTPRAFWAQLTAAVPGLHTVIVGGNWRFGHRAGGDVELLRALAADDGIDVRVPDAVCWQEEPVSSTRIRQAVEAGRLAEAEAMLQRRFSLLGTVVAGRQYGRQLGFPTANIHLQDEARPPTGVYAVTARFNGDTYPGAAYLGVRPTAQGAHTHPLLEVHLFDADLDLYGRTIEVAFVEHLRPDRRFNQPDELRRQIARDVQQARRVLHAAS